MGGALHLVRRFLGSLSPRPIRVADERWALDHLVEGERTLWDRMAEPDRKHAVGVARAVVGRLGETPRPVLAAALLHDVGKLESGLGTLHRVGATLAARAVGRARIVDRSGRPGIRGRYGRYLDHAELGARLLERAGSDPLTVAWARQHHLPAGSSTLPVEVADALRLADDD